LLREARAEGFSPNLQLSVRPIFTVRAMVMNVRRLVRAITEVKPMHPLSLPHIQAIGV
jgi:hypothetical protein